MMRGLGRPRLSQCYVKTHAQQTSAGMPSQNFPVEDGMRLGQVDKQASVLDEQNHQSPIAIAQRTRTTLASHSAIGANTTPTKANRVIRIATQRGQGP